MLNKRWLSLGSAILLACCMGLFLGCNDDDDNSNPGQDRARARAAILQALQSVYVGTGVPEAANYGTQNPRPTVLLGPGGVKHNWTDLMRDAWWPDTTAEAEMVVCIGPENEVALQTCLYNIGPPIVRHRFQMDVHLREAKTGRVVAKTVLQGTVPRPCPRTAPYSQTREDGTHVSFQQLEAWMTPYVAPGTPVSAVVLPQELLHEVERSSEVDDGMPQKTKVDCTEALDADAQ